MQVAFMSQAKPAVVTRAALYSRLGWYSRLATHAAGHDQTILDARCHLLVRTIMRRTASAHQSTAR